MKHVVHITTLSAAALVVNSITEYGDKEMVCGNIENEFFRGVCSIFKPMT